MRFSQQRMIPCIAAVNLSLKQAKNLQLKHLDAPVDLPDLGQPLTHLHLLWEGGKKEKAGEKIHGPR